MLLWPFPNIRKQHQYPLGERLYSASIAISPLFVKFGQFMSIRHDLFSQEITRSLSRLQDQVPPFCSDIAIQTIEQSLKKPLNELFLAFDPKPIASGSISQVHQVTLHNKTQAVIKVIRPSIRKRIMIDLRILKWILYFISICKRLSLKTTSDLISQYQYTLNNELDLLKEACNYSQMRRNFENSPHLYIPLVYWKHTHANVLTLEKIEGIPIDKINSNLTDCKKLAHQGINIFFTQIFKYRFFHADMHPGNIFFLPKTSQYALVDFGIVGHLSNKDHYYLCENFLAFYNRDYGRIAKLHVESGWVDVKTNLLEFEVAISHVCEPIFAKPLEDISISELMYQLIEISKPYKLKIQPQFLMLQKTLFYVEALGRKLHPKLNVWQACEPFVADFIKERYSIKLALQNFKQEWPRILEITPKIPHLIEKSLHGEKPEHLITKPLLIGVIIGIIIAKHLH